MFLTNPSKITISITALILGFALVSPLSSSAQLEVVNGDFENYTGLPSSSGMWDMMDGWTNSGSTTANPDYFHMDGVNGGDLPETPMAFIDAYKGRAIAGLEVCRSSGTNKREYLSGTFTEPLEIGKRYEFSFAVANGDVYEHSAAGLGVSHLGVNFSTEPVVQFEREPLNIHPNFHLDHVHYYQGWKIIKFIFTAEEEYQYFTFGMFGYDNGKQILSFEEPERLKAYYFIDDFSIKNISTALQSDKEIEKGDENISYSIESSTFVPTAFTPNGDNLNDVFEPSLEDNFGAVMSVYDRGGALVWQSVGDQIAWDGSSLSGEQARVGVYVWSLNVILEDGSVKELSGPVSLLQ
jgi:gliding motility-associated-like protein